MSQFKNNHNPNNKTTEIVVGLRLSNCWESHHTHHKLKTHDRVEMEHYSKTKVVVLYKETTVFEPRPDSKISPIETQKVKNESKIKPKSKVEIEGNLAQIFLGSSLIY